MTRPLILALSFHPYKLSFRIHLIDRMNACLFGNADINTANVAKLGSPLKEKRRRGTLNIKPGLAFSSFSFKVSL
jgi:hypothetical protein